MTSSEGENPAPQVWLTDADGTNARQLTDFADTDAYEGAFDPAFSPDGRTLAIDAVDDGVPGIFLIPAPPTNAGKLLTEADAGRVTSAPADTACDSEPQFSPDGRWIVFTRFSIECADEATFEDCQTRIYKVAPTARTCGCSPAPSSTARRPTGTRADCRSPSTATTTLRAQCRAHHGHVADGSHKHVIVRGDADSHDGNPTLLARTAPGSPSPTWPLVPDGNPVEPQVEHLHRRVTGHSPASHRAPRTRSRLGARHPPTPPLGRRLTDRPSRRPVRKATGRLTASPTRSAALGPHPVGHPHHRPRRLALAGTFSAAVVGPSCSRTALTRHIGDNPHQDVASKTSGSHGGDPVRDQIRTLLPPDR